MMSNGVVVHFPLIRRWTTHPTTKTIDRINQSKTTILIRYRDLIMSSKSSSSSRPLAINWAQHLSPNRCGADTNLILQYLLRGLSSNRNTNPFLIVGFIRKPISLLWKIKSKWCRWLKTNLTLGEARIKSNRKFTRLVITAPNQFAEIWRCSRLKKRFLDYIIKRSQLTTIKASKNI